MIKMVVTDLDGTLLDSNREMSEVNRKTLEELGDHGIIRVVATGRSVYSWKRVADESFPVDYLIFSCGSGIVTWPEQKLILENNMGIVQIQKTIAKMKELQLNFQVHAPIPNNHKFHNFCYATEKSADFAKRCGLYNDHILSEHGDAGKITEACHIIAITEHDNHHALEELRNALPELHVVRATSPLDGKSMWIEVYPPGVTKGHSLGKLCNQLGVDWTAEAVGVGNDYNDLDFLDIVAKPYVVENAPDSLKERYGVVSSNDDDGFSRAVEQGLDKIIECYGDA